MRHCQNVTYINRSKVLNLFFRRSKFSFHESVCKLLQNIDEDDFVDLIVECAHNKIVKAHRVILAMHSRILHQLLLLPDIEERLVESVFLFLIKWTKFIEMEKVGVASCKSGGLSAGKVPNVQGFCLGRR